MSEENFNKTYFPIQKKSLKDKDKQWREDCVDGVINICYAEGRTRRSSPKDKLRNYNLFNNRITKEELEYVLNPFNLSKEKLANYAFPAKLQPYDIVSVYFQRLLGEEGSRAFTPLVVAINDDAISEKQNQKKAEIMEMLEALIIQSEDDPDVEQLEKYKNYTPKMMRESNATKVLNQLYRKEFLSKKFNDCFKDVLLAGEEIMRIDKVGEGVRAKRVNPLEVWFQLRNNSDILDDADKIYERNQMQASEIIDEFYEFLTPTQIDEIEEWGTGGGSLYNSSQSPYNIPEVDSIYAFESGWNEKGITVHRVRWASFKKVGSWMFPDENGEIQELLVDETFKKPNLPGHSIDWFWIKEYWQGVKIGTDMFLYDMIKPRESQLRTMDNLSECKSGYVGTIYNATNSQSVSLMDRLVPWVYLYLIIWYRTELAIAKNLGKLALIDLSLIPDNWEPEKWIYYAHSMGFGFVNPYNESLKGQAVGQFANQSKQNQALDLETGNYIQGHIELLRFIEERIQKTSGVSDQRLGDIDTSALVGNSQQAISQSTLTTEPYFFQHEFFKRRVCETVLEIAKECMRGKNKSYQYVNDDLSTVLFNVDGDDFANADYGIFVSNAAQDRENLQLYKQLLQAAIQNDKITLSTVGKTLTSMSMSDIAAKLVEGEQEMMQQQQAMEQVKQQSMQQATQMQMQIEHEKMAFEAEQNQLDRENDIRLAEIKSLGQDAMSEEGDQSDVITKAAEIALKQAELSHKQVIEKKKLDLEAEKLKKEDEKAKQELKMQDKDHKHERMLAKEEGALKIKTEHIKARAARAKAAAAKKAKPKAKKK